MDRLTAGEIRVFRRSLGMNQYEFAALLDVSQTTVSYWENGRSRPGLKSVGILRGYMHLEPETLYSIAWDNAKQKEDEPFGIGEEIEQAATVC